MIPVWKMSLDQMLVNFWQGEEGEEGLDRPPAPHSPLDH